MRPSVVVNTRAAEAKGTWQVAGGGAGFAVQKAKHKERGGARELQRGGIQRGGIEQDTEEKHQEAPEEPGEAPAGSGCDI